MENAMLWVFLAGVGPFVGGLQPHDTHQTTHRMTTCAEPIYRQVGHNLTAAEERVFGEHLINLVHQF